MLLIYTGTDSILDISAVLGLGLNEIGDEQHVSSARPLDLVLFILGNL